MPWIWGSASGTLFKQTIAADGDPIVVGMDIITRGYAGHGAGVNNPLYEDVRNLGPLPQGWYAIGDPYDHKRLGKYVLPLTPAPETKMHGRSGFFIHGDNSTPDPEDGSHGCIVIAKQIREQVATSGDRRLRVVDI